MQYEPPLILARPGGLPIYKLSPNLYFIHTARLLSRASQASYSISSFAHQLSGCHSRSISITEDVA